MYRHVVQIIAILDRENKITYITAVLKRTGNGPQRVSAAYRHDLLRFAWPLNDRAGSICTDYKKAAENKRKHDQTNHQLCHMPDQPMRLSKLLGFADITTVYGTV